ncbi:GDSL esterase/lipase At5g37690-like [Wolffia australiana]
MERQPIMIHIILVFVVAVFFTATMVNANITALYVFGDSTVDVGNDNRLPLTMSRANFPPYGVDFPGGTPTGRFSNGFIPIDFLAQKFGFQESPPSFISIVNDDQAYRGVNFASGGSGIFDATGVGISISLNQQIRNFQEISSRLTTRIGGLAAGTNLSSSIFIFSTGSNDIIGYYAVSGFVGPAFRDHFIALLTNDFKNQLKTLYNLGARKFLVVGSGLIGCLPILRGKVPSGGCVDFVNSLSRQFNSATQIALQELAANLPGFRYSFVNVYDFTSLVSSDPVSYGLTDIASACCGNNAGCTPNAAYCSNRDAYFYWDLVHPTQAGYKKIVDAAFRGREYASPETIFQLAFG